MGYKECLEKAGCKILDFKEFGSYQGEWLAFVEYEGEKGIVQGSYGSCTGCDAFQAEFYYGDGPEEHDGHYYKNGDTWDEDARISKKEYDAALAEYDQRLADFGKTYLAGGLGTKDFYENKLAEISKTDDWFSDEEKESAEWAINQNWN